MYVGQRGLESNTAVGVQEETWSTFIQTIEGTHVHSLSMIYTYVVKSLKFVTGRFGENVVSNLLQHLISRSVFTVLA
jgi:hypothetical protein